jgi:hypothetical protein
MVGVHEVIGYVVVGLFTIGWVWGLGAKLAKRGPGERYWLWLTAAQVTLGVQALLGILLYATGHRVRAGSDLSRLLHYVYGALPIVLLVFAHVMAREGNARMIGFDARKKIEPWVPFAWVSFISFGLTLRALMTGLGTG